MKIEDAIAEVNSKPLVRLWPTTAVYLGISRSAVYEAASRGDIPVVRIGWLIKAVSAGLREMTAAKRAA
jgi:hypothetical protein